MVGSPTQALHKALHLAVRARERCGDFLQFVLAQLREQAALEVRGQARDAAQSPRSCRKR